MWLPALVQFLVVALEPVPDWDEAVAPKVQDREQPVFLEPAAKVLM